MYTILMVISLSTLRLSKYRKGVLDLFELLILERGSFIFLSGLFVGVISFGKLQVRCAQLLERGVRTDL